MRYAYRCTACEVTAEPREQPRYARRDRDLHRRIAHHGYAPDGEEILRIPGVHNKAARAAAVGAGAGITAAVTWWQTSPAAAGLRGSTGWLWARRAAAAVIAVYVVVTVAGVYL